MNEYQEPKRGAYSYRKRNFDGSFSMQTLQVRVLGETGRDSYVIVVFVPINGRPAGSRMTVRKRNVRIQGEAPAARDERVYDYSEAYWNR